VAAVKLASDLDLPIAVQATGHGPSVSAQGAMLINTRHMKTVTVDPVRSTAVIEAGAKFLPVIEAASVHGLSPLVGSTPDVSAVGYLTGGGLPLLGRRYGIAANLVRSIDVVTADGRLRHVTPASDADLFWAIRGGKSNFGVVTRIQTDLQPLERIYGGGLYFAGRRLREILHAWHDWTSLLDERMSTSIAVLRLPRGHGIPGFADGEPTVHIRVAYAGAADTGANLVEPLRSLGPDLDTVAEIPSARIGEVHNDPLEPSPVSDRGALLHELDGLAMDRIADLIGPDADLPPGMVEIRLLGGAHQREPDVPAALGTLDAAYSFVMGMLVPPGQESQVENLQQALLNDLKAWSTGRSAPNFLGKALTEPDQVRTAYSDADYNRLREIKSRHDPRNLFRINHNIPPISPEVNGEVDTGVLP
jgi:FAD/FMN-containing dehydrogenase